MFLHMTIQKPSIRYVALLVINTFFSYRGHLWYWWILVWFYLSRVHISIWVCNWRQFDQQLTNPGGINVFNKFEFYRIWNRLFFNLIISLDKRIVWQFNVFVWKESFFLKTKFYSSKIVLNLMENIFRRWNLQTYTYLKLQIASQILETFAI